MQQKLKRKTLALTAMLIICIACMGLFLGGMQSELSRQDYAIEFDQVAAQLPDLVEGAERSAEESAETFDAIMRTRAASVSFMATHEAGYEQTDAKMAELRDLLQVDNVLIVKDDGQIAARAQNASPDLTRTQFKPLYQCLSSGEVAGPVEAETPGQDSPMRYYAGKIDEDTMVVIEQAPEELTELIQDTGSVESALKNVSLGSHGYVMAVSADDHLITYHPNGRLVGANALSEGLDAADLKDGATFSATVDGSKLFCRSETIDDTCYILTIPESDMASSRTITVSVILFAFTAVVAAVVLYDLFVLADDETTGASVQAGERIALGRRLTFNRTVGKKATALSLAGFALLMLVTFYMQTLFALSSQSVINAEQTGNIESTLAENEQQKDELEAQYSERYTATCHIVAYIVEHNPALRTRADLAELAGDLGIASIYLYDGDGNMTISSTSQRSYSLSTKYGDSSYEFRSLLGGKDEYVQPVSLNRTTGEAYQYIGVATYDESGIANGIVQIAVRPKQLEEMLKSVQIDHVLAGIKSGSAGFAFAVDKDKGTVVYHPNQKLMGKKAADLGLTSEQMSDGFSDFITVDGTRLYATCLESSDCYIYVACPEDSFMRQRVPLTIATGVIAALCFIAIYPLLTLDAAGADDKCAERTKPGVDSKTAQAGTAGSTTAPVKSRVQTAPGRNIEVVTAEGRVKRSESALSRWLNVTLKWDEMSPEQKLGHVCKWFMALAVFAVFVAVLFKDRFFGSGSVFAYILDGDWRAGLNIFALTASIMYACVALTVCGVIQALMRTLSNVLGARGETVCRLLSSLAKYGTLIAVLYWCLGVLGVDTATLLASAGIITLAVSFGAKDLITDILCGLFIIFEGEFRVGDVISVAGSTGTVMEIGVRTTKINDGNGNVLLLRNSSISNVTNMTKLNSYASVNITVPVGESLPYIENALKAELPRVHDRVPAIIEGPFYKGVVALTDSAMTIRIVATCKETDRGSVMRSLHRELKLLLSRHDIAPYQLVFDHGEALGRKAGGAELRAADAFSEEQGEAAKDLGNEAGN